MTLPDMSVFIFDCIRDSERMDQRIWEDWFCPHQWVNCYPQNSILPLRMNPAEKKTSALIVCNFGWNVSENRLQYFNIWYHGLIKVICREGLIEVATSIDCCKWFQN